MGRAGFVIALATLVVSLLATASAQAALRWHACDRKVECARLSVPLDRSGGRPGTISLSIERRKASPGPARDVAILLAGGPGQSAISAYRQPFGIGSGPYGEFAYLAPTSDLVAFDQRGTGGSGLLRCLDLERASGLDPGHTTEACAVKLGPRRSHYTTSDSVEDIEALRQALGAPRLTLIGVSYGTYVAQRYAIRYPGNVSRMVLDSVVDTTGVDALYRDSFSATKRLLDGTCKPGCGFTRDLTADVGALVARVRQTPLTGTVGRPSGRRKPATLTAQGLFYAFGAGDVDPFVRSLFPAAVKSALRGDNAPILRLQQHAIGSEGGGGGREFSTAVLAATLCEDTSFPYPRETPSPLRANLVLQALQGEDGSAFAPFDAWTAAHNDLLRFCRTWPTSTPGPVQEPPALPDVPTLLIEGGSDTRTPVETARRVAARLPRAQVLVVPGSGHSVLGNEGCADRAAMDFLAGRKVPSHCGGPARLSRDVIRQLDPAALSQVRPLPLPGVHGAAARSLTALLLTLGDTGQEMFYAPAGSFSPLAHGGRIRIPGLRGGWLELRLRHDRLTERLHRLEYVPGVRISGFAMEDARGDTIRGLIRIGGPAGPHGVLHVSRQGLRGTIGGVRVRLDAKTDVDVDGASSSRVGGAADVSSAVWAPAAAFRERRAEVAREGDAPRLVRPPSLAGR